jgi:hypothetical protein
MIPLPLQVTKTVSPLQLRTGPAMANMKLTLLVACPRFGNHSPIS